MNYLLLPLLWLAKLIALPLRFVSWSITKIRARRYDPEKRTCPACGFSGDSGTNKKSCRVECIRITGPTQMALLHKCFRCGAQFATGVIVPVERWAVQQPEPTGDELPTRLVNGDKLRHLQKNTVIQPKVN